MDCSNFAAADDQNLIDVDNMTGLGGNTGRRCFAISNNLHIRNIIKRFHE